jgi:RNA polymerase sigma-70 factor (ECF subfamily)
MTVKDIDREQVEKYVAMVQSGDMEAFGKIYDMYVDSVYRYVFFKVRKEEALDLTENVFLKVWENIKSYKTGKYYFTGWLFKIAHNIVVDYYRLNKDPISLSIDIADKKTDIDPVVLTERGLSSQILKKAIEKLKSQYRQIILLKYINEMENREIARIMRRGEGSLRILKFRALKALKRVLEEMGAHY